MSLILNGTDGSASNPAVQGGTGGATTGVYYPASNVVAIAINGAEAMRLNSNSNLVLAGGTTTASGVGVTFPATQSASSDANCLDDYEKGTFTPVFATDGTQPTYTATNAFGYYTKIGRMVYYNFYIYSAGGATGGSGNVTVTGFPFSATTPSSYIRGLCGYLSWGGLVGKWTPSTGSGIGWQIVPGSATANLYANSTTYANGAFEIQGTGFYFV